MKTYTELVNGNIKKIWEYLSQPVNTIYCKLDGAAQGEGFLQGTRPVKTQYVCTFY